MRNMVKFSFVAVVISLISCSDFPAAPEYEFCKLADDTCYSVHLFSKSDCEKVPGAIIVKGEDIDKCKEIKKE